jgi:hypothetical protein
VEITHRIADKDLWVTGADTGAIEWCWSPERRGVPGAQRIANKGAIVNRETLMLTVR